MTKLVVTTLVCLLIEEATEWVACRDEGTAGHAVCGMQRGQLCADRVDVHIEGLVACDSVGGFAVCLDGFGFDLGVGHRGVTVRVFDGGAICIRSSSVVVFLGHLFLDDRFLDRLKRFWWWRFW